MFCANELAAELGFEPKLTDPESVVLPLHHSAAAVISARVQGAPNRVSGHTDSKAYSGIAVNLIDLPHLMCPGCGALVS